MLRCLCFSIALVYSVISPCLVNAQSNSEASVVEITSRLRNGIASGTGVILEGGQVLTCYHVIIGAKEISVSVGNRQYKDVVVSKISPRFDLALLSVSSLPKNSAYLPLSQTTPAMLGEDGDTFGYPSMLGKLHLHVMISSNTWVQSANFRVRQGEHKNAPLFLVPNVDLIPISFVAYDGISGAPLISKGRVVGVISGSYDEGGTIGWAIPVKYINEMISVNTAPMATVVWPPLELMSPVWKSFRRDATLPDQLLDALDNYDSAMSHLRSQTFQLQYLQLIATQKSKSLASLVETKREIARRGEKFVVAKDPVLFHRLHDNICDCQQDVMQLPNSESFTSLFVGALAATADLTKQIEDVISAIPDDGRQDDAKREYEDLFEGIDDKVVENLTIPNSAVDSLHPTLGDYRDYIEAKIELLDLATKPAYLKWSSDTDSAMHRGVELLMAISRESLP